MIAATKGGGGMEGGGGGGGGGLGLGLGTLHHSQLTDQTRRVTRHPGLKLKETAYTYLPASTADFCCVGFQVFPWMIPWAGWCKLASRSLHSHHPKP